MENLWFEYERTQLSSGRRLEEEHPEVKPLTRLQEIYAWENYAIKRFLNWIEKPRDVMPAMQGVIQRERADLD